VAEALELVFGYGVGLDLTRRDLQAQAKERRLPWDTAKGFDASAPLSPLVPAGDARHAPDARLWLEVNGELRQQAPLSDMVFSVAEVIHELSRLFALRAGDLIFMGTPSGVAALQRGDRFRAGVDGLLEFSGPVAA
jgi:fumarylpyruvate hydrolase